MIPPFIVSHEDGLRTQGRERLYKLPRPITAESLHAISARFIQRVLNDLPEVVHFVAIANSGVLIAGDAMAAYRHQLGHAWIAMSVLNLSQPVNTIDLSGAPSRPRTVVVDNSMKTGQTMIAALGYLQSAGIEVDAVVKLVDYGDALEGGVNTYISSWFDVDITSLYTKSEIDAHLSSPQAEK